MRMIQSLAVFFALAAVSCSQQGGPVGPRVATTLDPAEIGISKFVFEATPPIGEVMTIRFSQAIDFKKNGKTQEIVQSTNGGMARQVVLVYDPMSFPFGERKEGIVLVRHPAGRTHQTPRQLLQ